MRRFLILLLIALLTASSGTGIAEAKKSRTASTVRQERRETKKKIERTRTRINDNSAQVRTQLADLDRLQAEIKASNSEIKRLGDTVDSLSQAAKTLADSVAANTARVEKLKASYSAALRTIRSQRQIASPTAYIFSSRSFTEARKRMRYLQELNRWQKDKACDLKEASRELEAQKEKLDSTRTRLSAGLASLRRQKAQLQTMQANANTLVSKLRKQGRQLEKELAAQQEKARRLDRELNRIIEEEARKAAEEERRRREAEEAAKRKQQESASKPSKPAKPGKPATSPTPNRHKPPTGTPAASSFEKAKGKLPMPVSGNAVIVSEFGRHTHESLGRVEVQNNGIDIETTPGSYAVAVYPGVVSMVIVMEGYHNVVLVRHGAYLTVYAGLGELNVRKGQEVKAGQALGLIYSDPADSNRTRLHFEVRHEKDKLNPGEWLR